jgi:hypothetical protein
MGVCSVISGFVFSKWLHIKGINAKATAISQVRLSSI